MIQLAELGYADRGPDGFRLRYGLRDDPLFTLRFDEVKQLQDDMELPQGAVIDLAGNRTATRDAGGFDLRERGKGIPFYLHRGEIDQLQELLDASDPDAPVVESLSLCLTDGSEIRIGESGVQVDGSAFTWEQFDVICDWVENNRDLVEVE